MSEYGGKQAGGGAGGRGGGGTGSGSSGSGSNGSGGRGNGGASRRARGGGAGVGGGLGGGLRAGRGGQHVCGVAQRRVCEAGRYQPAFARRAEQRLRGSLRRSWVLQPGLHLLRRACCKQCWSWQRCHFCNWWRPGGAARVRFRCMAALGCRPRAGLDGASSRKSHILHPTTNLFSSPTN